MAIAWFEESAPASVLWSLPHGEPVAMRSFRRGREIRRELWISALVSAQYVVDPLNSAIDSTATPGAA